MDTQGGLQVAASVFFAAVASLPARASADEAPPIQRSDYALEIFQGPLLAPGRITGLAGATTATAESLEGVYNNAAAPAVREAHSIDHFEWAPTAGIAFPGAYGGTDFNNRGERGIEQQIERSERLGSARPPTVETTDRFLYLNAGLWGQLGGLGLTATADMLRYDVAAETDVTPSLAVGITRLHLAAAYGFFRNQLVIGAGARLAYVDVVEKSDPAASVVGMFGAGPQAGVIIKPEERPWRVGLTGRAPVSAAPFSLSRLIGEDDSAEVTRRAGGSFVLPERIVQPWELEAGVAYQLGPRPLNPVWIDPSDHERELAQRIRSRRDERRASAQAEIAAMPSSTARERGVRAARIAQIARDEAEARAAEDAELADAEERLHEERRARYLNWPREHLLLLASVLLTGASHEAVALEGFIDQRRELVGRRVSVSPRFAIESEAVPNLLKTRAGVYLEPSRFVDGKAREHFTIGVDVRVLEWSVFGLFPEHQWRLSAFLDFAERYQNFGFGVGTWH